MSCAFEARVCTLAWGIYNLCTLLQIVSVHEVQTLRMRIPSVCTLRYIYVYVCSLGYIHVHLYTRVHLCSAIYPRVHLCTCTCMYPRVHLYTSVGYTRVQWQLVRNVLFIDIYSAPHQWKISHPIRPPGDDHTGVGGVGVDVRPRTLLPTMDVGSGTLLPMQVLFQQGRVCLNQLIKVCIARS